MAEWGEPLKGRAGYAAEGSIFGTDAQSASVRPGHREPSVGRVRSRAAQEWKLQVVVRLVNGLLPPTESHPLMASSDT